MTKLHMNAGHGYSCTYKSIHSFNWFYYLGIKSGNKWAKHLRQEIGKKKQTRKQKKEINKIIDEVNGIENFKSIHDLKT